MSIGELDLILSGIRVEFLVYSDVRSCKIIFKELMEKINENIEEISKIVRK